VFLLLFCFTFLVCSLSEQLSRLLCFYVRLSHVNKDHLFAYLICKSAVKLDQMLKDRYGDQTHGRHDEFFLHIQIISIDCEGLENFIQYLNVVTQSFFYLWFMLIYRQIFT